MDKNIGGEDISYNNPPLPELLEINARIDDLEDERLSIIVQVIVDELKRVIRDWGEDDIQQDCASIQIYHKGVFVELRYIVPFSGQEYIDVMLYDKGVIEPILLRKGKVEVMDKFFIERLFEAIDRMFDYANAQYRLKE